MKVILYTIGCPRCLPLEMRLKKKEIEYIAVRDEDEINKAGISVMPTIDVITEEIIDGVAQEVITRYPYSDAMKWVGGFQA